MSASNQFLPLKNSDLFESVQNIADSLITWTSRLPYGKKPAKLYLIHLSYRRNRSELITVFKLLDDNFSSEVPLFFPSSETEDLSELSKKFASLRQFTRQMTTVFPIGSSMSGTSNFNEWLNLHLSTWSKEG